MTELAQLLEVSAARHNHLCPRQVLGVRMGILARKVLNLEWPPGDKRLLTIVETDGCFADGIEAATGCAVGHRTLRVEDYAPRRGIMTLCVHGKGGRIRYVPVKPSAITLIEEYLDVPIYLNGQRVDHGEVREYSDQLLMQLLKGFLPEVFGSQARIEARLKNRGLEDISTAELLVIMENSHE